jgi:hypothetical protein
MAQVTAEALGGLVAAAARESEAASALAGALREVRDAMESLDPPRMEVAVARARRHVDGLALAANAAASLSRLASRASGLSEDTPLAKIGENLGIREGATLAAAASRLAHNLQEVAVEAAAQGLAARYSAGLWGHLVGLRGEAGGYSSRGRMRPGSGTLTQRA